MLVKSPTDNLEFHLQEAHSPEVLSGVQKCSAECRIVQWSPEVLSGAQRQPLVGRRSWIVADFR